jgi:hypothetical protein
MPGTEIPFRTRIQTSNPAAVCFLFDTAFPCRVKFRKSHRATAFIPLEFQKNA